MGFAQIKNLREDFSFEEAAKRIADAVLIREKQAVKQEKPAKKAKEEPVPAEYQKEEELLKNLSKSERDAVSVFLLSKTPSQLIGKERSEVSEQMIRLRDALRSFPAGAVYAENVTIAGVKLYLRQDKDGMLTIGLGNRQIPLPVSVSGIVDRLEVDMIDHDELYDDANTLSVIAQLQIDDTDSTVRDHTAELCTKLLEKKTGMSAIRFSTLSTHTLQKLAMDLLMGYRDAQSVQQEVQELDDENLSAYIKSSLGNSMNKR